MFRQSGPHSESMKGGLVLGFLLRRHAEDLFLPEFRDLMRMALQLKVPWMLGLDKSASTPGSTSEKLCDFRQVTESLSLFAHL